MRLRPPEAAALGWLLPLARSGHPKQAWQDLPPPNHNLLTVSGGHCGLLLPQSTCWLSSPRGAQWPRGDLSHLLGSFSSHCSASIPSDVYKEGLNFRIAFSHSFEVNATGRHAGLAWSQPFCKDAFALVESHSRIFSFIPLTIP